MPVVRATGSIRVRIPRTPCTTRTTTRMALRDMRTVARALTVSRTDGATTITLPKPLSHAQFETVCFSQRRVVTAMKTSTSVSVRLVKTVAHALNRMTIKPFPVLTIDASAALALLMVYATTTSYRQPHRFATYPSADDVSTISTSATATRALTVLLAYTPKTRRTTTTLFRPMHFLACAPQVMRTVGALIRTCLKWHSNALWMKAVFATSTSTSAKAIRARTALPARNPKRTILCLRTNFHVHVKLVIPTVSVHGMDHTSSRSIKTLATLLRVERVMWTSMSVIVVHARILLSASTRTTDQPLDWTHTDATVHLVGKERTATSTSTNACLDRAGTQQRALIRFRRTWLFYQEVTPARASTDTPTDGATRRTLQPVLKSLRITPQPVLYACPQILWVEATATST